MILNEDSCFRACQARDVRFDGVFFIAVKTTGIYCRPVCPARTPRRDRCRFYPHAAAAERDGFRPCLRCRPELAPGRAPMDSSGKQAQIAAMRIEQGALNNGGNLEQLAKELDISTRQLRRQFQDEFGVSPIELAQTKRLLLAKQMLTETDLSIIDVAFASGFESVRRFNSLFRSRYGLTPSQMRRSPKSNGDFIQLTVAYRPPYAWEPMLQFLAGRSTAGVECVEANAYLRTVAIEDARGWIKVEPIRKRDALAVSMSVELLPALPKILFRIRSLFDINARPDLISSHLRSTPSLFSSMDEILGLRVPGAFDPFELVIRAILGQQISVKAATTLAGRLAAAFGEEVETPFASLNRLCPKAERLATVDVSQLKTLGITTARANSILAISQAVAAGDLQLAETTDPAGFILTIKELPGIGEWTAQYIAMRAIHWPDAFPHRDLGLLKASGCKSARELQQMAEAWRPWRAYAALQLWNF